MTPADEIKPLTSIRMLAAALVLFYHFSSVPYGGILDSIFQEGHTGVTIFFALSGFLITLRYYPAFRERGLSRGLLYDFFTKRFARIYPLFAFALTFVLLVSPEIFSKQKALISYTLTQGFFSDLRVYYIAPAWTLSVEEFFYLLSPLVFVTLAAAYLRSSRLRTFLMILAGWVILLLIIGLALVYGPLPWRPFGFMDFALIHMISYTLFGRFFDFACGIFTALLFLSGRLDGLVQQPRAMLALSVASMVGIGTSMYLMHLAGGPIGGWGFNYPIVLFACSLFVSLLCAQNPVSRLLSHRVLVYGGKISYAVYLLHLTPLMKPAHMLFDNASPLIYHIGLYLGATVVGIVLYELIEKPARRRILALAARYKHRFVPPVTDNLPA